MKAKEIIARRVAQEFKDGDVVNLGFGIPNASADYIPEGVNVILQAENGALRFGETPTKDTYNPNLANSGGAPITLLPGAALFDLQTSFAIIRGGHVDATVLGALEVSQDGSIANWIIPGKFAPGMGGAMDLLVGAKRVIGAIQHTTSDGESKLLPECTLPLSAKGVLDLVITELAVFGFQDGKFLLKELAPGVTLEEVLEKNVTVDEVNAAMKAAANESYGYTEDPIVSSDIVGMSYGSLFDATQTKVLDVDGKQLVKVVSWYDNEMSYTAQLVRTLEYFAKIAK